MELARKSRDLICRPWPVRDLKCRVFPLCILLLCDSSPESRVFILVALARVSASNWFNIMTRLASFYRK